MFFQLEKWESNIHGEIGWDQNWEATWWVSYLDLGLSLTTYFRPRPRCWSHLCWNAGRKTENIKATSPHLLPLHPSQFISLPNLCSNYAFYQRSISIYFRQSLDFCGQISEINSLMSSKNKDLVRNMSKTNIAYFDIPICHGVCTCALSRICNAQTDKNHWKCDWQLFSTINNWITTSHLCNNIFTYRGQVGFLENVFSEECLS